jgi:hypothetical protein
MIATTSGPERKSSKGETLLINSVFMDAFEYG